MTINSMHMIVDVIDRKL